MGSKKYREPMVSETGFSHDMLFALLKDGHDFVVLSTFSNTIKIPYTDYFYAHEEIYFKEYEFKGDDFNNHWLNEFLK
jgi:hypothetical protein